MPTSEQDDADIGTLCGAVAALQVGAREGGGVGGRAGAAAGAARVEQVAQLQGASGVGLEEEELCQALAACTFHGGGAAGGGGAGGAGGPRRRVRRGGRKRALQRGRAAAAARGEAERMALYEVGLVLEGIVRDVEIGVAEAVSVTFH
jgi:hypothetical protein